MTQERTGVSEGASVHVTPANPPEQPNAANMHEPSDDGALRPADSPAQIGRAPFTLEAAKAEIERLQAEHDSAQKGESRRATAIELGKRQIAALEAELDNSPLVQLHGLTVVPTQDDDHLALVYQGVAGA